jgi:hypothetical protein
MNAGSKLVGLNPLAFFFVATFYIHVYTRNASGKVLNERLLKRRTL